VVVVVTQRLAVGHRSLTPATMWMNVIRLEPLRLQTAAEDQTVVLAPPAGARDDERPVLGRKSSDRITPADRMSNRLHSPNDHQQDDQRCDRHADRRGRDPAHRPSKSECLSVSAEGMAGRFGAGVTPSSSTTAQAGQASGRRHTLFRLGRPASSHEVLAMPRNRTMPRLTRTTSASSITPTLLPSLRR